MSLIHQIFISTSNSPLSGELKTKTSQLQSLYSDHTYKLYNKEEIRTILKDNFKPIVLQSFDDLAAFAHKSDLAKICLLYLYGGYYFDLAVCPSKKIDLSKHDIVLTKGITHPIHTLNRPVIENNFLYSKSPGHPLLKKIIDKIVDNVYNLDYGIHPLDITAPMAIGRVWEQCKNEFDIKYCTTHLYQNEDKYVVYNDEHFYDFKPNKHNSDISKLGAAGVNRYDNLWFNNLSFNIRFSYVFTTHNPLSKDKIILEKKCLNSVLANLRETDELIIIGDVSHLNYIDTSKNIKLIDKKEWAQSKKISHLRNFGTQTCSGNVVINMDNDILLPPNFHQNLLNYISSHKTFDAFNTKIFLPDGGRCWGKAIYKNNKLDIENIFSEDSYLIPHEFTSNNVWYNNSFLIRKKSIADICPYNESLTYKGREDIKIAIDLQKLGYNIKIDTENLVFHCDYSLFHVKDKNGDEYLTKDNIPLGATHIKNKNISKKYRTLFKSL